MIKEKVESLLKELPPGVDLLAAVKGRTSEEILQAIDGGIKIVGENYVQEAENAISVIGRRVKWHFIGHLQVNKVKKAVALFDMIETVDSEGLAREIDKRSKQAGKVLPILIEVNSGRESQKSGVIPDDVETLARNIALLPNIQIQGLMTMGPEVASEKLRAYFRESKTLFDNMAALKIPGVEMKYLSMGMSNSYRIAIEEGANLVRVGRLIFEK